MDPASGRLVPPARLELRLFQLPHERRQVLFALLLVGRLAWPVLLPYTPATNPNR